MNLKRGIVISLIDKFKVFDLIANLFQVALSVLVVEHDPHELGHDHLNELCCDRCRVLHARARVYLDQPHVQVRVHHEVIAEHLVGAITMLKNLFCCQDRIYDALSDLWSQC